MSTPLIVLGREFKRFKSEESLAELRLKNTGVLVAIDPESKQVTIREGYIKRLLSLYTGLHDYNEVYYYRDSPTDGPDGINKLHVQFHFLNRLDNENAQKSAVRKLIRYRRTFPDVFKELRDIIPNLETMMDEVESKFKVEV